MSVPGRQLMETGHGAHPDTTSPGRGPAPVTPGSPVTLPKAWGQPVLLVQQPRRPGDRLLPSG